MVRECLRDKVMLEKRPEGREDNCHVDNYGKSAITEGIASAKALRSEHA